METIWSFFVMPPGAFSSMALFWTLSVTSRTILTLTSAWMSALCRSRTNSLTAFSSTTLDFRIFDIAFCKPSRRESNIACFLMFAAFHSFMRVRPFSA